MTALAAALAASGTVGLEQLGDADLQRRVDRKYLVDLDRLLPLLGRLRADHRVLEVGGATSFGYSSSYVDTPDLLCFRAHRQGRRLRWKARTRRYDDSGRCRFEVKLKTGRGETDKHALLIGEEQFATVPEDGRLLLSELLTRRYGQPLPEDLQPGLVVQHLRSTLVAVDGTSRLTLDSALRFTGPLGTTARLREHEVLVETKSATGRSPADRLLWSAGARPVSVSKYCAGVVLTDPHQPDQPWRRLLREHFVVTTEERVAA